MIRRRRTAVAAAVLIAAGVLSGCAATPRPPLYSPLETTGRFGYFTEDLGEDRVRVGYRAPIRRDRDLSRAERDREGERLVSLSYELALLRAAELASARGAPSFDVSGRENDVDSTLRTVYAPDPFYPPWPYWHRRYYDPFPFYGAPYYGTPYAVDRSTEVTVSVVFTAELRRDMSGAFDTAATLRRLWEKYPPRPEGAADAVRR